MRASATFTVVNFEPTSVTPSPAVATALPTGVSLMEKRYAGQIEGRSATIFTSAFDQGAGTGAYLAMESFDGTVNGVPGTFNFMHSASTQGTDRSDEFFSIVTSSGTGGLAGIHGGGGLTIDEDGTHRVWFDYEFTHVTGDGRGAGPINVVD